MTFGQALSVVTPAWNEALNLPVLYRQLAHVLDGEGLDWEWIVVDDHSSDETFAVLQELARQDGRVRGVRLSRNFGSHAAILCGLAHSRGGPAAVLAADLQDPPEVLLDLLARWQAGAQVVWATRATRPGAWSRLYYLLMRRLAAASAMPANGADVFLLDRVVVDALQQFEERHNSLFALITWMGFRQDCVICAKSPRLHGRSGWTLRKKIALFIDSATAFTYAPIRMMSYVGIVTALLGFAYAAIVVANALTGHPPSGWSSLIVTVLVLGGLQMVMMGVLGEYVWRALEESRRRPRYLVERATPPASRGEAKTSRR